MYLFQERDFGEKINATFTYAVEQFRTLLPALFYIAGPIALLAGIGEGIFQSNMLRPEGARLPSSGDGFGILYTGSFFMLLITMISRLAASLVASLVVYSHLKIYNQSGNIRIEVGAVWAEVVSNLGRSVWISFLSFWLIVFGVMLMFIPGLYIGVVLSLALPVTVFEGTGFGATLNRCFQLIRDKWWSTFGLTVIMAIIVFILALIFAIPNSLLQVLKGLNVLPELPSVVSILFNALTALGSTLLSALLTLAIGFQYFNLVERQEGTSLLSAINTIGTSSTRPTAQDEGDY